MDFLTNLIQQPVTLRSKQTELTPAIILDATLTFLLEFLTVNSIQFGFFTLSVYLLRGLQIFIKRLLNVPLCGLHPFHLRSLQYLYNKGLGLRIGLKRFFEETFKGST